MSKVKILLIAGARPNFIKIAGLWHALKESNQFEVKIVHTGQHYDINMSGLFFEQLELPQPDYNLEVGSASHAVQTAKIMLESEKVFLKEKPDMIMVVGDVNSTIACALTAKKMGIKVAHVEAGLRSYDMEMPEEINRILTDRISDLLLCSEPSGVENLKKEGFTEGVYLVGNTMIDTLARNYEKIKSLKKIDDYSLINGRFVVSTMHRPSNVDTKESLLKIIEIFKLVPEDFKIVIPLHPRTRNSLIKHELFQEFENINNIQIIEPIGYLEFINLVMNSKFVLTDSGGIQEETTYLGIPCITLRENTERPFTITNGTNIMTGLDIQKIKNAIEKSLNFDRSKYYQPELWDGLASKRIAEIINVY